MPHCIRAQRREIPAFLVVSKLEYMPEITDFCPVSAQAPAVQNASKINSNTRFMSFSLSIVS
jgi:hypothetical protein